MKAQLILLVTLLVGLVRSEAFNFIEARLQDEVDGTTLLQEKKIDAVLQLQVKDRTLRDQWEHIIYYHVDYDKEREDNKDNYLQIQTVLKMKDVKHVYPELSNSTIYPDEQSKIDKIIKEYDGQLMQTFFQIKNHSKKI